MTPDLTMYKLFKKLKEKYPSVMVTVTEFDIINAPDLIMNNTGYVQLVERKFKEKGLRITRFSHNYKTNELGLVFLAGDSVLQKSFEVHGLVGYNVTNTEEL